jgi:folate-binding Fe-S cluster repair protein YgfZ
VANSFFFVLQLQMSNICAKSLKNLRSFLAIKICKRLASNKHFICYNLTNYRSLVSIKGLDSAKYLQGLITNDIHILDNSNQSETSSENAENNLKKGNCIYSMILNNRGRVLFDVIIYKLSLPLLPKEEIVNEYLIEIDSNQISEAIKLLQIFKVKKKVKINSIKFKTNFACLCSSFYNAF